jgi:hypothetical protein
MRNASNNLVLFGSLCVAMAGVAACSPKHIPVMTVEDLMEDRVTLDGILMKCNQNPAKAHNDVECHNARVAVERLAHEVDPAVEAKRTAEFERSREQLRLSQEKVRQAEEAKAHVDPYSMPLIPIEPAPTPSPATSNGPTAGVSASSGPPPSSGIPPAASQPKL